MTSTKEKGMSHLLQSHEKKICTIKGNVSKTEWGTNGITKESSDMNIYIPVHFLNINCGEVKNELEGYNSPIH